MGIVQTPLVLVPSKGEKQINSSNDGYIRSYNGLRCNKVRQIVAPRLSLGLRFRSGRPWKERGYLVCSSQVVFPPHSDNVGLPPKRSFVCGALTFPMDRRSYVSKLPIVTMSTGWIVLARNDEDGQFQSNPISNRCMLSRGRGLASSRGVRTCVASFPSGRVECNCLECV